MKTPFKIPRNILDYFIPLKIQQSTYGNEDPFLGTFIQATNEEITWVRGWKQHTISYLPLAIHYSSFLLLSVCVTSVNCKPLAVSHSCYVFAFHFSVQLSHGMAGGRTQALPPGAGVSASFPSGSGAWGATWKHTEDTGSLRAPRVPPRLSVPDRPHLGPLDRGPQTPAWFCWALRWPMGVPVPSLPLCSPSQSWAWCCGEVISLPDQHHGSSPASSLALSPPIVSQCWGLSVAALLAPGLPCGTVLTGESLAVPEVPRGAVDMGDMWT